LNAPEPRLNPDSGMAALAALASHHRLPFDEAGLRHRLALGREPVGDRDLLRSAKMTGLKARRFAIKAGEDLIKAPRPSIVGLTDGSYRILVAIEASRLKLFDPATRILSEMEVERFLEETSGSLILVTRRLASVEERLGFAWLWTSLKKHRMELSFVLAASLVIQLFALATPLLFQIVIDKVLVHYSRATLVTVVVAMVLLVVFQTVTEYLRTHLLTHTASRIDVELGAGVFSHLIKLPVSYFETRAAGQTVARVRELDRIRQFITGQALTAGLDVVFALLLIACLYLYSTTLAIIVTLTVPAYIVVALVLQPMLHANTEERFQKGALSQQHLVEAVLGVQTLKSTASEPQSQADWEDRLAAFVHASFRGVLLSTVGQSAIQWISRSLSALVLLFGAWEVMEGRMTVGGLVAFNMIMSQVSAPVLRLSQLWQEFQQVRVAVDRLGDVLSHPTEPRLGALGALPPARGHIRLSEVTFRYRADTAPVIENLSLDIAAGTSIGIIGPSGSGKSTLSKLVQRLYVPERGQVLVDGIDISQVDPTWLRRQVGVVLQENFLFNRSIHDNIALANPAMTRRQVMRAAELAGASGFIAELSAGYDTILEERGANLSGGQRQRLAIARALATNPRILILDEATSALDYESEEAIQANMREIAKGRTVIIIAHRLAAVTRCDRIVTLARGKIAEDGAPQELVRTSEGFFARMLQHQNRQVFQS